MENLSLKKLKLDADDMLQREQLKSVFGGYGGGGNGVCSVYFHYENGPSGWSTCSYSVAEAQALYQTGKDKDEIWGGYGDPDFYVSGYCCESCPAGVC